MIELGFDFLLPTSETSRTGLTIDRLCLTIGCCHPMQGHGLLCHRHNTKLSDSYSLGQFPVNPNPTIDKLMKTLTGCSEFNVQYFKVSFMGSN